MKVSDEPPRLGLVRQLSYSRDRPVKSFGQPPFSLGKPLRENEQQTGAKSTRLEAGRRLERASLKG